MRAKIVKNNNDLHMLMQIIIKCNKSKFWFYVSVKGLFSVIYTGSGLNLPGTGQQPEQIEPANNSGHASNGHGDPYRH
ncbi:hypothetical protein EC836_105293 [Erwinia sp. JUb26]|nr:hypothetical protein EC836_105293 [Erwinia sp. JUb26]